VDLTLFLYVGHSIFRLLPGQTLARDVLFKLNLQSYRFEQPDTPRYTKDDEVVNNTTFDFLTGILLASVTLAGLVVVFLATSVTHCILVKLSCPLEQRYVCGMSLY
jgi:hypothetical protein